MPTFEYGERDALDENIYTRIFDYPIYRKPIANPQAITDLNSKLEVELHNIYQQDEANPNMQLSNSSGFGYSSSHPMEHNKDVRGLHNIETPLFLELFSNLNVHLEKYLYDLNIDLINQDFVIGKSWFNVQSAKTAIPIHDHTGGCISGIYYVKLPKNNNPNLSFYRNHLNVFDYLWRNDRRIEEEYNTGDVGVESVKIKPIEGDVVLFPSHLKHGVEPTGDDMRIVISFDIYAYSNMNPNLPVVIIKRHFDDQLPKHMNCIIIF